MKTELPSDDEYEVDDGVPMPQVPAEQLATWEEFWRQYTDLGRPVGPVILRQHSKCGGSLTLVIEHRRPALLILCLSCGNVLTTLKLQRGPQ